MHVAAHQHVDLAVERGGEQQRLAVVRDLAHDPLDLRQEAHVGHAVGLVDDEDADLRRGRARPARAGRSGGRASRPRSRSCAARLRIWRVHRRAAVERGDAHADLSCRAGSARRRPAWRARGSARARARSGGRASAAATVCSIGQAERERLARAGLGLAAHVAAGEGVGDGRGLDGEGSSMPCAARASTISARRPSSRNVVIVSPRTVRRLGGRSSAVSGRETGEGRPRAPADGGNPKHQNSWSEHPIGTSGRSRRPGRTGVS